MSVTDYGCMYFVRFVAQKGSVQKMTRLESFWAEDRQHWHFHDGKIVIHDDAPEEIKESYERYLKQVEAAQKRGTL